jgi:PiT family inorganic phosphate transporter
MPLALLFVAGLFLAWSNGANDNVKGVATLVGGGTLGRRAALLLGTGATLLGSFAAVLLSGRLLAAFSGKGIVPDALVGAPTFLFATGLGAALVVSFATWRGLPVSTTHALVGGLSGAALAAAGASGISWSHLGVVFALPLLLSPLAAALLVMLAGPSLTRLGARLSLRSDSCLCVGEAAQLVPVPVAAARSDAVLLGTADFAGHAAPARIIARFGDAASCPVHPPARGVRVTLASALTALHVLSAIAVSFARGLNDTPKIAAILLTAGSLGPGGAMAAVGGGMAVGALLAAARVGRTMSDDITRMSPEQGLVANLSTSALVLGASRLGMPVSTTHVSVGSLFGLGRMNGGLVRATMRRILLAWVVTLPAAFGAAWVLHRLVG